MISKALSAVFHRMDTEVGTWANLWFGPTNVGIWRTSVAVEIGEHGKALEAAKTVHPELLPGHVRQAEFWADVGRALVAGKKTRDKGVRVLLHAEELAPQRIATTCSSARSSPACCGRPGATPVAGSCVAWRGAWESPRSGESWLACTIGAQQGQIGPHDPSHAHRTTVSIRHARRRVHSPRGTPRAGLRRVRLPLTSADLIRAGVRSELLASLALGRASSGRVAKSGGDYFEWGHPLPSYPDRGLR
ncbi:MAG: hypothetical protein DLM62_03265 [Pseudonocardiales bacterium]|nr:MAG: hypothetical protein DLM62_03265 [Pseudonocardiales bacterium]